MSERCYRRQPISGHQDLRILFFNELGPREGSTAVAFPPPLTLAETDDGPLWGPFFFLFQRCLAVATALRRLAEYPKSVSEPALSLTDRPRCSEGRINKVHNFQCVGGFEGAPFSKSQAVSKYDANRGTGLSVVVFGGKKSFAALRTRSAERANRPDAITARYFARAQVH